MPTHAKFRARRGFSLVELVVVLAILTLLAGIAVPIVSSQLDRANQARAKNDLSVLAGALVEYRSDTGYWPANTNATVVATGAESAEGFTCLYANTWARGGWDGPYLTIGALGAGGALQLADAAADQGFVDPWGNAYQVYWFANGFNASAGGIALVCGGKDGAAQTSAAQAFGGAAQGDDAVYVVTRKL
ncbi:MAG: prepilin-type N-terminal cleavage/methylation domain-containing protein [Planctomycetota bacterium]|nr:MAG: prepilin-type N-terminal cleavage/methylation domain-containing protein [Planctomycetota bacterium]